MLSKTTSDALDHLTTWYFTPPWQARWEAHFRGTLEHLAESFNLDKASLMDKSEREGWHVLLAQMLVERFAEMEFDTLPFNATDDYLKRRGWKESREGREYLTTLKEEPFSIYAVLAVKPGEGMTVQDLIRPCPAFEIHEVSGSQGTRPREYIFGKVVPVSGQFHFTGCVFRMRLNTALERVEEIQQAILDQGLALDVAYLPQINPVVRSFWAALLTDCVDYLLFPYPVFTNSEGHRMLMADIRFPIKDKSGLVLGLNQAPDFHQTGTDDQPQWNWFIPPEAKKSLSSVTQDLPSIRANLTLTEQGLKGFADSRERAEMLVSRLQEILPSETLGQPIMAYQSPESALSQPGRLKSSEPVLAPEIEQELLHSHLDKHYRGLLDSPIPMLKHQSPRDASQSPEGQDRLRKWLLYLESQNERATGAMAGYDFGWLWEELGVPRPSRSSQKGQLCE